MEEGAALLCLTSRVLSIRTKPRTMRQGRGSENDTEANKGVAKWILKTLVKIEDCG